jgi:hypothetical protein
MILSILGLAIALATVIVGWFLLINHSTRIASGTPSEIVELVKVGLIVAGGTGGAGALVVAYRKQQQAESGHRRNEADHDLRRAADARDAVRQRWEQFDKAIGQLVSCA